MSREEPSTDRAPAAPAPAKWTRLAWAHALLLCLATCAHWWPRLGGPIDLRYDAGVYYVLGTSLAEGRGYRLLNEPGEIEAIQYPPLLPAWVAAHQLVLGSDDPVVVGRALRCSSFVLSLAYALAAYALARRWLRPWSAWLAAQLAVLYFHTVHLQDLCFTEVPFALVVLGFLLAHGGTRPWQRVAAPALAVLAFLLRTAGVALLVAWALEALLARDWRRLAGRVVLAGGCVLGWQAHAWSVKHGPEYDRPAYAYQRAPYQFYNVSYAENLALLDPFAPEKGAITPLGLVRRGLANAPRMVLGLGESVSAPRGFWEWPLKTLARGSGPSVPLALVTLPLALLGLGVLGGLALLARDGRTLFVLFVLFSLALVAPLPWPTQVARYLTPLVPLLTLALLRALDSLPARARRSALGGAGLLLALQVFTLGKTFTVFHHRFELPRAQEAPVTAEAFFFEEPAGWRGTYAALAWLAAHTPPHARVASSSPHLVWIHARRQAVMPPFEADPARAQELLDSASIDYVVLERLAFLDVIERYTRPALERHPELWETVFVDPAGEVEVRRRR